VNRRKEETMKKCGNCKNRYKSGWFGAECCYIYETLETEKEEIDAAASCREYEEGTPDCLRRDEDYISSASGGDYGPSSPWNAPGMSIRDFI
jgi:hypothetical protein